jgi:hypothetical protein
MMYLWTWGTGDVWMVGLQTTLTAYHLPTLPSVLGLPTDSCSLLFLVKTRASALGSAVGAGGVWWSLAE